MIKMSLKDKILISVAMALFVSVAVLSWSSYSAQKTIIIDDSKEQAERLGEQQSERISDWLVARMDVVKALSTKLDGDIVKSLQQAKDSGRFSSTYFGTQEGKMFNYDPTEDYSNYDPRSRPWYQEAKMKSGVIVTKPYMDVTDDVLVVTIAQAVSTGVVAGDVSITDMVEDIKKNVVAS
nr:cache domain-containing protein [Aeromonas veronii]